MKIKRFEASSMSDALRMIKKEFGEDAVILSAKSIKKKSRIFGNLNGKQVVVTAAIDTALESYSSNASNEKHNTEELQANGPDDHKQIKNSGLKFLKRYKPITRTGQQKLQPKLVRMMSKSKPPSQREGIELEKRLLSQGVEESLAKDLHQKAHGLNGKTQKSDQDLQGMLSQILSACAVVGPASPPTSKTRRIMVMVGAGGAGKTTTAAKFAAKYALQLGGHSVALLSLDDQRIAGQVELERYAHIIGVELKSAYREEDLNRELHNLQDRRLVIVDTPGFAATDRAQLERLRKLIQALPGAEVNLILSADADNAAMVKTMNFFKPLAPQGLIFTRLDWAVRFGGLINMPINFEVPITHLCDSPKVPEGIQIATAERISTLIIPTSDAHGSQQEDDTVVTIVGNAPESTLDNHYVANRNSDIFHHRNCKTVKRINKDNMVMFKDPAEAMGQKFKPCRMCCSELIISKPVQRLARNYASYR